MTTAAELPRFLTPLEDDRTFRRHLAVRAARNVRNGSLTDLSATIVVPMTAADFINLDDVAIAHGTTFDRLADEIAREVAAQLGTLEMTDERLGFDYPTAPPTDASTPRQAVSFRTSRGVSDWIARESRRLQTTRESVVEQWLRDGRAICAAVWLLQLHAHCGIECDDLEQFLAGVAKRMADVPPPPDLMTRWAIPVSIAEILESIAAASGRSPAQLFAAAVATVTEVVTDPIELNVLDHLLPLSAARLENEPTREIELPCTAEMLAFVRSEITRIGDFPVSDGALIAALVAVSRHVLPPLPVAAAEVVFSAAAAQLAATYDVDAAGTSTRPIEVQIPDDVLADFVRPLAVALQNLGRPGADEAAVLGMLAAEPIEYEPDDLPPPPSPSSARTRIIVAVPSHWTTPEGIADEQLLFARLRDLFEDAEYAVRDRQRGV